MVDQGLVVDEEEAQGDPHVGATDEGAAANHSNCLEPVGFRGVDAVLICLIPRQLC